MNMNHTQAAKKRWRVVRNARAARIREWRPFRLRPLTIRTPFGVVRYVTHPLFLANKVSEA